MDKETVLAILANYRVALEQYGVHAERVVLFGSFSHGTARQGSDIDVVIVSKDFERMDFWQRIDALAEAICDVREPIEAIGMTPDEWESGDSLITDFAKQGELVYAA